MSTWKPWSMTTGLCSCMRLKTGQHRSYGLHVAALAGVPKQVIEHAQQRLQELENNAHHPEPAAAEQMTLFQSPVEHPLVTALKDIDPDDLSPRQAQQALYRLKEQADQELHS